MTRFDSPIGNHSRRHPMMTVVLLASLSGLLASAGCAGISLPHRATPEEDMTPESQNSSLVAAGLAAAGPAGLRISVCSTGAQGNWTASVSARISCNGGAVQQTPVMTISIPCGDANAAAEAIAGALGGLGVPPGLPGAGTLVFDRRCRTGVPNTPTHANKCLRVNPVLAQNGCQLVNVSIRFCTCITVDLALLSTVSVSQSVGATLNGVVANVTLLGEVTGGSFMLWLSPDDEPIFIPFLAPTTAELAARQVAQGLTNLGFQAAATDNRLTISAQPDGSPLTDVWGLGAPGSGLTEIEFGYTAPFGSVPIIGSDGDGQPDQDPEP